MRPRLSHKIHQIVERIAFNIEFAVRIRPHQCRQRGNITRPDVATVWSRVNRDAIGAGVKADARKFANIRDAERTRVAQ